MTDISAEEVARVHADWVEVERNETHVKYRGTSGKFPCFTVQLIGQHVYWPNRMDCENRIVLGRRGYKAWLVRDGEDKATTSNREGFEYIEATGQAERREADTLRECKRCASPIGLHQAFITAHDDGPFCSRNCAAKAEREHDEETPESERTGPYGGNDATHEAMLYERQKADDEMSGRRAHLLSQLASEQSRPVVVKHPGEGRLDRVYQPRVLGGKP